MADVAVISRHERGFWQADLYLGASDWTDDEWDCGAAPDGFCTRPELGELQDTIRKEWPAAEIRYGQSEENEDHPTPDDSKEKGDAVSG